MTDNGAALARKKTTLPPLQLPQNLSKSLTAASPAAKKKPTAADPGGPHSSSTPTGVPAGTPTVNPTKPKATSPAPISTLPTPSPSPASSATKRRAPPADASDDGDSDAAGDDYDDDSSRRASAPKLNNNNTNNDSGVLTHRSKLGLLPPPPQPRARDPAKKKSSHKSAAAPAASGGGRDGRRASNLHPNAAPFQEDDGVYNDRDNDDYGSDDLVASDSDSENERTSTRKGGRSLGNSTHKSLSPSHTSKMKQTRTRGGHEHDGDQESVTHTPMKNRQHHRDPVQVELEQRGPSSLPQDNIPNVTPPHVVRDYYMENVVTGNFKRITKDSELKEAPPTETTTDDQMQLQTENDIIRMTIEQISFVTAWLFFTVQGLLGGASLLLFVLSLYSFNINNLPVPPISVLSPLPRLHSPPITGAASSAASFLRFYSSIARPVQHLFFFLTSVSLLGACDRFARDRRAQWNGKPLTQPVFDIFLIVLFTICFVFTLANVPIDDALYYSEQRIPGWYGDNTLVTSSVENTLQKWQIFNGIRCCAGIAGWVLASFVNPLLHYTPPPAPTPVTTTKHTPPNATPNPQNLTHN